MAAHILLRHISSGFSPHAMRYAAGHYRNKYVFDQYYSWKDKLETIKKIASNPKILSL